MTLTRFDRWIIKTFVYEWHVSVMQLPDGLPRGAKIVKLEESPGNSHRYRLEIRSERKAKRIVDFLQAQGLLFKSTIHERRHWYNGLIANPKNSFTFRLFWFIVTVTAVVYGSIGVIKMVQTEKFQEIMDSARKVINV